MNRQPSYSLYRARRQAEIMRVLADFTVYILAQAAKIELQESISSPKCDQKTQKLNIFQQISSRHSKLE